MVQLSADAVGDKVKEVPTPTAYHPRWYRSRVSTYWWLGKWSYLVFILRELSSVFIAFFVFELLLEIRALSRGAEAYAAFREWLRNPLLLGLNVVSLFFILFHTLTWFNLAPRAMVLRVRGKRLPDVVIASSNYLAWLVVSVVLARILLGG